MSRQHIYDDVEKERVYAEKWGTEFDDTHTPADWWTFVTLYYSRYLQGWKNPGVEIPANFRTGLVKMAAIIIGWIEALERRAAK